ncbi:hypothetical protein DXG01_011464, partial [Tephrocybe rancida]
MHRPNTRSKQTAHPAPTQASKRKTRGSKATIDNNEPVNDPPPAKSGGRKPLRKTVEADKGDEEAIAMSAQDWAVVVAGEYEEYCKQKLQERWEDPMERAQLLQPMVKWYKERYDDFIDEKKVDGTFHKIIAKTRDEFMHSAQLASQYHDLHCFGFIMNLHPDETGRTGSMMWGVTRAYELMKKKQKKIISEEMAEWESLL